MVLQAYRARETAAPPFRPVPLAAAILVLLAPPMAFGQSVSPYAGLWVGAVTLQSVSQPRSDQPQAPRPAGGNFQFRLILHVDADGRARLLKQVALLARRPTAGSEPSKPPARQYRLLVSDPNIRRAAESEKLVGVKISTIAFDFPGSVLTLSGRMAPGQSVRGDIRLDHTVATNPFMHRYHPDHSRPEDVFVVERRISLELDGPTKKAVDPGSLPLAGLYRETLSGLHRVPVSVAGRFELRRIATTETLGP